MAAERPSVFSAPPWKGGRGDDPGSACRRGTPLKGGRSQRVKAPV